MDLSHAERLWGLAALPLLWLLARPLRPRSVVATPYLALWRAAQQRLARRPVRFPWLRLLLLVLAFAAATLAFAGARTGHRDGPTGLCVILDASASMAARPQAGAPTAFEQALARVQATLARLPAAIQTELVIAGGGYLAEARPLAREPGGLAGLAPGPGAAILDLARLQRALANPRRATWCLTDGLGGVALPSEGALTLVGERAENLAITAASCEDAWPLPELEVHVEVQNLRRSEAVVSVVASGAARGRSAPERVATGASHTFSLALRRELGGALQLALEGVPDALAIDDAVTFAIPAPPAPDLAVLSESEDASALRAAARALALETGGRLVEAGSSERATILLMDGGAVPPAVAGARQITFGTRFATGTLRAEALLPRPTLVDWDRTSPLLRGLDLSELTITQALAADFGGPGSVLLVGADAPLACVRTWPEGRSVHFAFPLEESNLALLPAFPSLLRRAFAACWRERAEPRLLPPALLDAAESDLGRQAGAAERPLPEFGAPGTSLVVPLLLLALAALVARIYS